MPSPGSLPSRHDDGRAPGSPAGVRGLVLDADGVLVLQAKALPGSVEAVRSLDERGIRSAS